MGGRINMIMQTCFFKLASVIPADEAIGYIKKAIAKTYAKKGQEVVDKNIAAVDATLETCTRWTQPENCKRTRHPARHVPGRSGLRTKRPWQDDVR